LLAGSIVIAEETNAIVPAPETLVDRSIQVDSRSLNAGLYGQPLTISFAGTLGNGTVEFDNVRLDALPVPEPNLLFLVGAASAC
jgi:hypothetical protein